MSSRPVASVIISTYNNPRYLELVLLGYARQTRSDFEVVVADDGSRADTRELVDRMRSTFPVPLIHAWQEDIQWRKARALNLAVLNARAKHLIFTDGDCIPPAHFVDAHLRVAAHRTLIVGGCVRLAEDVSKNIHPDSVRSGDFEQLLAMRERLSMHIWHLKNLWYIATGAKRRPKIQGLNCAVDRSAFEEVNGWDLAYENSSREDSDLRNRLRLAGVRARCIWHSCIVFHLWHARHRNRDGWAEGDRYYSRSNLAPWASRGIRELALELRLSIHGPDGDVAAERATAEPLRASS